MHKLIKFILALALVTLFNGQQIAQAQTPYSVGGSVSGLSPGKVVTLLNNRGNARIVTNNGNFTFSNGLTTGAAYNVTVGIQPAGQSCLVMGGTGTVTTSSISTVSVICSSAFSVGGTVSGLTASGLVLKLNNAAILIIPNGASTFKFATSVPTGSSYAVSIGVQPSGHFCAVTGGSNGNGTGTMANSAVSSLAINCVKTYKIGGSITGLTATGLILRLNDSLNLPVSNSATTFMFSTALPTGSNYSISIFNSPIGLSCFITNPLGVVAATDISDIIISCAPTTYTVGGSVTGLNAGLSLTLLNNGANALTVNGNGDLNFTFSPAVLSGAAYNVTVDTQPTGQYCTVTNGSGSVGSQNISNVSVSCVNVVPLNASIVLGTPTTNSIAMKLFTPDQNGTVSVSYGTSSGSYSTTTDPVALVAGTPLALNIANLANNTQYFYRINYQAPNGSSQTSEYKFHTARPVGDTFTFAIQADPHMDEKTEVALYQQTLNNIVTDAPDFLVDLGDTFMTEKHQVQLEATVHAATSQAMVNLRYQSDLPLFGMITHSVPLFLVNGNHDAELGWLATSNSIDHSLPTWAFNARQSYFPNPIKNSFYDGENVSILSTAPRASYYSWKWGDALFIALDPFFYSNQTTGNDGWNLTLGKAQYDWLANTLAVNAGMKYKFVFMHNLVGGLPDLDTATGLPIAGRTGGSMRGGIEAAKYFEWGGKNSDGTTDGFATKRQGWSQPIHQLLKDNNVTAVFHGHDHLYADQELDGIKYQEVPQPSAGSTSNSATLAKEGGYLSGNIDSSSGYLKITVSPSGVTTDYVRSWLPAGTAGTNNVANGTTKINKQISKTWTVNSGGAKYAVGGTVNGLNGTVTLTNNLTNTVTLSANGSFNFSKILTTGSPYSVTVSSQPIGQICSVENGNGVMTTSNIVNVLVNCAPTTFTVSGTVSGHTGAVTLTNNGVNALTIPTGTTTFTFPAQNYGTNWSVAISSSPAGETCSVSSNGTGTNITTDVINISVICGSSTYKVGGSLVGLGNGLSVTLLNNNLNPLTLTSDGTFAFTSELASGAHYQVSISTQPIGQTCLITNASGNVGNTDTTNVLINCSANSYTVGGMITGLNSGLSITLQNNLGDDLIVTNTGSTWDGTFTFPTAMTSGNYAVTVKTNPTEQTCTVANGAGSNISTNVTTITVTCTTNSYDVQMKVNGLGTNVNTKVILQNSLGQTLTVAGGGANNTNYKFGTTKYPSGTPYAISVLTQPTGKTCIVTNGVGTISGATVNIAIACANTSTTGAIYTVGGSVTGLSGPLVLTLSSSASSSTASVTLAAGSSGFTFPVLGAGATATLLSAGSTYTVTSGAAPTGQTCTVNNGSGTIVSSSVSDVSIACKFNGYTVSGTISGHTGAVTLTNNGLNGITLNPATGAFTFPEQLPGSSYAIAVVAPTGQSCQITNGSGTNINTNINNVIVNCITIYSVGGTVSGLKDQITLLNNGGDPTTLYGDGNFVFNGTLLDGSHYDISIQTQPFGQTCFLSNPSGLISGNNVINVLVNCSTNTYTIGGTVSGLGNGLSLSLLNNNSNELIVTTNGSFNFTTPLAAGPYFVSISSQPEGQTCSVSNGTGTVSSTNISTINVSCTSNVNGCSSPAHATAPSSDPFWTMYSSPTLPAADTSPTFSTEQINPFDACLNSG